MLFAGCGVGRHKEERRCGVCHAYFMASSSKKEGSPHSTLFFPRNRQTEIESGGKREKEEMKSSLPSFPLLPIRRRQRPRLIPLAEKADKFGRFPWKRERERDDPILRALLGCPKRWREPASSVVDNFVRSAPIPKPLQFPLFFSSFLLVIFISGLPPLLTKGGKRRCFPTPFYFYLPKKKGGVG